MFLYQDIHRLSKVGVTLTPQTLHNKMKAWQDSLDFDLMNVKDDWCAGGKTKFQLVGDNWDKNILPSYRSSQHKTLSLHLFNVIGVVDRISMPEIPSEQETIRDISQMGADEFIPSTQDLALFEDELTFLFATSVVEYLDQLNSSLGHIYPKHLEHKYSNLAGVKTQQV